MLRSSTGQGRRKSDYTVTRPELTQRYLRVLLYGLTGSGKSRACAGASRLEEMSPTVFVDVDVGGLTVLNEPILMIEDINTFDRLRTLLRDLRADSFMVDDEPITPKTLVIDSLSHLYEAQLRDQAVSVEMNRWVEGVPSESDYLIAHSRLKAILDSLRKIPIHIVCTAHVVETPDLAGGLPYTRPGLPGKMANAVVEYFDIVGYLYTRAKGKEVRYYAQFQGFSKVLAKERSPWKTPRLGPVVDFTGINLLDIVYRASILGEPASQRVEELSKEDDLGSA